MASTIKLKNGSGAPTTGDLVQGEPALDLTNKRLYTENASGVVIEVGTNPSTIDINAGTIDGTVIGGTTPAAVTGTTITGTSFVSSGDMTFEDNDKAVFGNGSDLRIYHTGSHSTIENIGTGHLQIHSTDFRLRNSAGTESMILANADGNVQLYYDNALKLATTSTGIDVTGTVTADKVTIGTSSASNGKLTLEGVDGADSAGIYFNNTTATNGKSYSLSSGNSGEFMLYDRTSSAYRLFVTSAGNVGIGTSSPAATLQVEGETRIYPASGTAILRFGSGGAEKGKLSVDASSNMAFETANSERMRIDSSGHLLVGTTDASSSVAGFRAYSGGNGAFTIAGQPLELNRLSSDGSILGFQKDGAPVGSIGTAGGDITIGTGDTGLTFEDSADVIHPINQSTGAARDNAIDLGKSAARFKDLYLSGGVYLGGTGAANKLDDYEEGTWTPEIYYQNATDQGNATNTTQTGYYTKIGRVVTLDFRLIWNITGSPANDNIGVKNLPFTGGGDTFAAAGVAYPVNNSTTIPTLLLTRPVNGGTTALCQDGEMSSNLGNEFGSGNAKEIRGTVTYFTDA
jgi:hypothetical protein